MEMIYEVTATKLNMRDKPSLLGKVKGTLSLGDRIIITNIDSSWATAKYGYYVSSKYIKFVENVKDSKPNDVPVVSSKVEYISTSKLHIVKVPKDTIAKLDFVNIKGGMYVNEFKKTYGADILINGTLFDMKSGVGYIDVKDENIRGGYLGSDTGLGIKNHRDIVWCTGNEARKDNTIHDFIGGSPTLVVDGKVNIQWGDYYDSYINGSHVRSCVGFDNKGTMYFVCTKSNMKLNDLANELIKNGVQWAINLDGGSSSTLWFKDKRYKTSGRKIANWIMVKMK